MIRIISIGIDDANDPGVMVAEDEQTGQKAYAKCAPGDKFDYLYGAHLALTRLYLRNRNGRKPDTLSYCKNDIREKVNNDTTNDTMSRLSVMTKEEIQAAKILLESCYNVKVESLVSRVLGLTQIEVNAPLGVKVTAQITGKQLNRENNGNRAKNINDLLSRIANELRAEWTKKLIRRTGGAE